MSRSNKRGRISTAKHNKKCIFTARLACRISVATTAFLQLPAFFASCSSDAPITVRHTLRIERAAASKGVLDVFVFDGEAPYFLDSYQQFPTGRDPVFMVSTPGRKRLVAISSPSGDLYSRVDITRYQDLSKEAFSLLDDSPDNPFSYGEITVGDDYSGIVSMNVKPLLSSIRVRSVSCDFSDRYYSNCGYHNDNLYLINAVSETCPLGAEDGRPVSWLNYGFPSVQHPFLETKGIGDIGPERVYCDVTLYCYPNPHSAPPTRLVLEGEVGENRCYYPIDLPVQKGGTRLILDITIHRMGTHDPDSPALPGMYTLNYYTEPWYEKEPVIETF